MIKKETLPVASMQSIVIWQRAGVTILEAFEAIKKMQEAAAKAPFPDRKQLRLILMGRYRRELGPFRFFHPGWWDAYLSR